MALPVLDGNQSATTLSSVVTGGEHIVAHSVVSLGTTAIANIASAVSGVNIGGTVTANINGTPSVTFGAITGSASIIGTPTVTIPQLNRVIQSVATDGVADATLNFVKIGGHQSGSNQTAHIVHVSDGGAMSVDATDSVVSISNFPSTQTIAGTVTANVDQLSLTNALDFFAVNYSQAFPVSLQSEISGTVTANVQPQQADDNDPNWKFIPIGFGTADAGAGLDVWRGVSQIAPLPVSNYGSVTIGSLPSGALTTRFGSVTTANTAQITSAVTNTSRKYLLAQNISTGTVTIGIGFSPTTTQGIQLAAGGGLTFDAFCPTGAVYWLGAVTGAAFTILEG